MRVQISITFKGPLSRNLSVNQNVLQQCNIEKNWQCSLNMCIETICGCLWPWMMRWKKLRLTFFKFWHYVKEKSP